VRDETGGEVSGRDAVILRSEALELEHHQIRLPKGPGRERGGKERR
jgi:hypothetical protein